MFQCADLIDEKLSEVARESLRVAKDFAHGRVEASSVEQALLSCWKEADKVADNLNFQNPVIAGVRAIICILREQLHPGEFDLVDIASFYLELLNSIEPHFAEQEILLKESFSACL